MNGILCVNKPQDFTSFDVVAKLRGILGMKRLGHAGTLDPMATGVLPVFVGTATKACDIMPDSSKSYVAGFRLGQTSDTQDVTGKILTSSDKSVCYDDICAVLPDFMGKIMQIPPMYSAVQVNGKRLYDLARQGLEVERKARETEIKNIRILEYDG
ncbi:MAG: tRNA pseudouridine(55) synthase TruB, partial [Ruminococcus sp.]|nr:tRNA pseudouridine(55) synthase TruB [Ruminococcus sp.]